MTNTFYTSQTVSGYNANPPDNDGTESSDNQVDWDKHKTKLGDPLKTTIEAINTQLATAFGKVPLNDRKSITSTYTTVAGDRGKLIECTGTFTVNLLASSTAGQGYMLAIVNNGSGTVTLDGASTETINDAETMTLAAGQHAILLCDGTSYVGLKGLGSVVVGDIDNAALEAIGGLTPAADKLPVFSGADTATLYDVLDEDDMASDSATAVATQQSILAKINSSNPYNNYIHVQDQKSSGTNGGTASSGSNTRTLNTVVTNNLTGASLASNRVTLPAGTYEFDAKSAQASAGNAATVYHQLFLYNYSDTAEISNTRGLSVMNNPDTDQGCSTLATASGRFTLASEKTIELRHAFSGGVSTIGLGVAGSLGTEVYSDLKIWKVA